MKKNITNKLKDEILLTLKNENFEVSDKSQLGKIFNIEIRLFEVFESPRNINIDRECKIELLQWLKQGFIQTDNSSFGKTTRHPTFLEIMIASSQIDDED
jgi:hypothetical protein